MENTENTENTESTEKQDQQQNNDKVSKRFDANMQKLAALFKGDNKSLAKKTIPNNDLDEALEELVKERKEIKFKLFKEKAHKILDGTIAFDKYVAEEKKKFDQAIINKKKEFNKEMEECFNLVADINIMVSDYKKILNRGEVTEATSGKEDKVE